MTLSSTQTDSCKGFFSEPNQINGFPPLSSRSALATHLAKFAAASLVAASAGLGAVYAWTVGSQHGVVLGALFVLFAVGLLLTFTDAAGRLR